MPTDKDELWKKELRVYDPDITHQIREAAEAVVSAYIRGGYFWEQERARTIRNLQVALAKDVKAEIGEDLTSMAIEDGAFEDRGSAVPSQAELDVIVKDVKGDPTPEVPWFKCQECDAQEGGEKWADAHHALFGHLVLRVK